MIPRHIVRPNYSKLSDRRLVIKNHQQIQKIKDACQITKNTLQLVRELIKPGVTTQSLNDAAHNYIISQNAYPSPLGYQGFPASICTSVNEVVCHGVPSSQVLELGDLISVDITCFYNGYHGDACRTFSVGPSQKLIELSKDCTMQAIQLVKPGVYLSEIGKSIEEFCSQNGVQSVRELCGHGIGQDFHELPYVLHHKNDDHQLIREGMVFTVEPMVCAGSSDIEMLGDGWTIVTQDSSKCAQHEETLVVTSNGFEVLTSGE